MIRLTDSLQGSPDFFVRGPHKLLHNSSRAGHLTECDCFGICCILQYQLFVKILFFHCWKMSLRPEEMASWAGFGPRAVVWRSWFIV